MTFNMINAGMHTVSVASTLLIGATIGILALVLNSFQDPPRPSANDLSTAAR